MALAEKQEGTNKLGIRTTYFTYLVRTESALPGMRADGAEVRRRFSEFDVSGAGGGGGGGQGAGGQHGMQGLKAERMWV